MEKIWFIEIDGTREGPFSLMQLRNDRRVTPDTLVWKKGFASAVPIRNVPELSAVFADEEEEKFPNDEQEEKARLRAARDELALDLRYDPSQFFFWLLIAIILIGYILYKLYWLQ